jgi:hypothetical protein
MGHIMMDSIRVGSNKVTGSHNTPAVALNITQ